MNIDKSTKPHCKLEERTFEWGEPYIVITPLFDISASEYLSSIEFSIDIFGMNNIKEQLLRIYNKLSNYEEYELENFHDSIENRDLLIDKIDKYLEVNLNAITPWEKYKEYYDEMWIIEQLEDILVRKLVYAKVI